MSAYFYSLGFNVFLWWSEAHDSPSRVSDLYAAVEGVADEENQ